MTTSDDELLSPQELADYLNLSLQTVYQMNRLDSGPKRMRIGKYVRYRRSDIESWLKDRVVESRASA